MLLYHGTDTRNVDMILTEGIRPRPVDADGNWPTAPSKANFVYLTSVFAPFYAMNSAFTPKMQHGVNPVIFEVDLDVLGDENLYPDEDFIDQRRIVREKTGEAVPLAWSLGVKESQDQWQDSLRSLGTVGVYGGVPVDVLTRYAVIDLGFTLIGGKPMTKCPILYNLIITTPGVSIAHYGQEGDRLRDLQAFLMGDTPFCGSPPIGYKGRDLAYRHAIEAERQASVTVQPVLV